MKKMKYIFSRPPYTLRRHLKSRSHSSHFGSNVNQRRRARLLYVRIYQSRTESLIYLSPLCRRLSSVYLNTSKEMEMYLDDSSSERKII